MKKKWLIPRALGFALLWINRPGRNQAVRLPTGNIPMPAWTMRDLEDRPVASTNFAGKVLILNFWAKWCVPCVAEIPDLKAFHAAHEADGVVVLGASIDEDGATKVKQFTERNRINYPVLLADPAVQELFGGVSGVPTTFIVDRGGRMVARYHGPLSEAELRRAVAPLLSPSVIPAR
jgi:thiol-disulfide isomerase/thioredoxin